MSEAAFDGPVRVLILCTGNGCRSRRIRDEVAAWAMTFVRRELADPRD